MKRTILTLLAGLGAGVALQPVIKRHAPAWREMCQRMCSRKGCECGTKTSGEEDRESPVAEKAA